MNNKDIQIKLLIEYIELLVKELNNMASIAHVHGWQSELIEEGKSLRQQLKDVGINL